MGAEREVVTLARRTGRTASLKEPAKPTGEAGFVGVADRGADPESPTAR
jgi:hypothetical protein